MKKFFSKEFLCRLISKNEIVSFINTFLKLEKRGFGYYSICPFHKEKTPSFHVSEKRQAYYCFGCFKKGDVIQFLIDYKKFSFLESVNFLIKTANIDVKKFPVLKKERSSYKLNEDISFFFSENLKKKKKINKNILNFFDKRNFNKESIEKFQIGYAENSWDFLLKKFGVSFDLKKKLISLGLLVNKNKKNYDRFRNRIIFPIRNVNGFFIGFGGRSLNNETKIAKYINSPESLIFSKRKHLYGLYESRLCKKNNNDTIIVVEGYTDVIMLHQYNITNVVAILGTSFTREHFFLLKSMYKNIIFCYDGDKSGKNASLRTAYSCLCYLKSNVSIKFLTLPDDYDPDLYLRVCGKEKFSLLIKESIFIIDYIYKNFKKNLNMNSFYDKTWLYNNVTSFLKKIPDEFLRKMIFNDFCKKFNISSNSIFTKNSLYQVQNRSFKKKIKILPLGLKGCLFLLKKKSLIKNVNLDDFLLNKNIKFKSDINMFIEFVFLLRRNKNLSLSELNLRMLREIKIHNDFNVILDSMLTDVLEDEFKLLVSKMLQVSSI